MGSPLRLAAPASVLDAAWPVVLTAVASIEHELTRFDAGSALSRLNRQAGSGRWVGVSPVLRRAVRAAARGYRITGGRFDPRIIGALEALGEQAGVPLPLSPGQLDPGERWLEMDQGGRIRLASPIDLGGIGKGIAVDAASRALRGRGLTPHLVESGGDVVVAGSPPDGGPWRIAVEHPDRDLPLTVVELRRGALATSSIRVRRWIGPEGEEVHHLIDPATGRPAHGLRSVTVHAPTATLAEIWSTAAFVGGSGHRFMAGGHAAWWISAQGEQGQPQVGAASQ